MKERISSVPGSEFATTASVIDLSDAGAIDAMPIDELRALCKRMACQCGLFARMTQEETAQAMLDVLAETALKPIVMGLNMKADIQSRMTAIDKWLDRKQGKPTQAVTMSANLNVVTVNANINFIPAAGDKVIEGDVDSLQIIDNK